jgi:hypothetical protein
MHTMARHYSVSTSQSALNVISQTAANAFTDRPEMAKLNIMEPFIDKSAPDLSYWIHLNGFQDNFEEYCQTRDLKTCTRRILGHNAE